jgi:hypothetical protein
MNDPPHLWLVDSQGFFDSHLTKETLPFSLSTQMLALIKGSFFSDVEIEFLKEKFGWAIALKAQHRRSRS